MCKVLESHSLSLNWNPTTNPSIKGSVRHRSPSHYLDDISDILFQFDVSLTCVSHYFSALNLHTPKSYENLTSAFKISSEVVEFVNEFLINSHAMLNR